jgi:hypothetical protein
MGIQARDTDIHNRLVSVEQELRGPFLDVVFLINNPLTNPILTLTYTGPDYTVYGKALQQRNFYETKEEFYSNAKLTAYIDGIEQTKGDNNAIKWVSPTSIQINGSLSAGQKVMIKYSPLGRTKYSPTGPTEFFYIDEPNSLPTNAPSSIGLRSLAIGDGAQSRVDNTINLSGTIITKNVSASGNIYSSAILHGAGAMVTVTTPLINLAIPNTTLVTFPNNTRFWLHSVSISVARFNMTSLTATPHVSIGTSGNPTLISPVFQASNLTANHTREIVVRNYQQGLSNLLFTVNTPGTGVTITNYDARVTYTGHLVEIE